MHRLLIAAIATGAGLIAGIGFTGSYTAVRDLATTKGFGAFAYLFPIGIDAGICVLLALDLLLTHHRCPLPLLRHTAWLLTTATIAFNAATAWPDPLGVGMHAVTPLLFITTAEAARHATGRLAAITADTHMDGVRPARWFLAPVPTFLLWRRMKLWEQRSYRQALDLEQQRLLYQAQLRNRYGRTWRRKAPAQTLIPLRLARYGIPPAGTHQTTDCPATPDRHPQPAHIESTTPQPTNAELTPHPSPALSHTANATHPTSNPKPPIPESHAQQLQAVRQALYGVSRSAPTPTHWARWHRHGSRPPETDSHPEGAGAGTKNSPAPHTPPPESPHTRNVTGPEAHPETESSTGGTPPVHRQHREPIPPDTLAPTHLQLENGAGPAPNGHQSKAITPRKHPATGSARSPIALPLEPDPQAASQTQRTDTRDDPRSPRPSSHQPAESPPVPRDQHQPHHDGEGNTASQQPSSSYRLTLTDRYYLAWMNYQTQHGTEPTPEQLSTRLAAQGLLGRGGTPLSPSNLRRHLLNWRIYNLWTTHHTPDTAPSADDIARQCATHHITGQYNRPVTPTYITQQTPEFQRRRQALTHHEHHQPDTGPTTT
ncbi:DUF2637 domain-containing protein [Streptomyces sp. NPDC051913]|uniref:DUF2637 domain-containing protein n=1 Tax=Streptomyces sp. NPDC051913 TaxID=3365676 RepID=UPI0037D6AF5C